jgi:glutathione synthase/RimK-type ligase-like ATP-grasp enzyme
VKNKKIGLIGQSDDPGLEILKRRIEDLGAEASFVDFWHFPAFANTHLGPDTVVYDGVDLTAMDAFYLRKLGYFSPLPRKHFTKEEWAAHYEKFNEHMTNEREVASFKESVIQILCELRPVVNPYETAFFHKLKANQYRHLAVHGLPVPEFIAGNDYFELREFASANEALLKPLTGGFVSACTASELEKHREDLRKRPIMLQKRIEGRMLRTFVLGGRAIGTCEIVHDRGDVDSRRNIVAMEAFDLTPEQERMPIEACRCLGMLFAGVDLMLESSSGRLFVLECNPAPQFRNFEAQSGIPVSRALASYLVEEATK